MIDLQDVKVGEMLVSGRIAEYSTLGFWFVRSVAPKTFCAGQNSADNYRSERTFSKLTGRSGKYGPELRRPDNEERAKYKAEQDELAAGLDHERAVYRLSSIGRRELENLPIETLRQIAALVGVDLDA